MTLEELEQKLADLKRMHPNADKAEVMVVELRTIVWFKEPKLADGKPVVDDPDETSGEDSDEVQQPLSRVTWLNNPRPGILLS